jgi:hypothetical protein
MHVHIKLTLVRDQRGPMQILTDLGVHIDSPSVARGLQYFSTQES